MNAIRRAQFQQALTALPKIPFPTERTKNGEDLDWDEAAVWKRVLNHRITANLRPKSILETHPGLGISTSLFLDAYPGCNCITRECISSTGEVSTPLLIDVDPFGQPWDTLSAISDLLERASILMISNGEAQAVHRNLVRAQRYPTMNFGKKLPLWVTEEYIPRIENETRLKCIFFYAFPTTIRTILGREPLPESIFEGCPRWMWWLAKYKPEKFDAEV